jgi:hypothetical protein
MWTGDAGGGEVGGICVYACEHVFDSGVYFWCSCVCVYVDVDVRKEKGERVIKTISISVNIPERVRDVKRFLNCCDTVSTILLYCC